MRCVVCGAELPEGAAFCDRCGASQTAPAAETVPFAPVAAPASPAAASTDVSYVVAQPVFAPPPSAVAPPAVAATAYAPPPAAARSSKGLVIGIVVAGAVIAIGALAAVAVFIVLPSISAKPSGPETAVSSGSAGAGGASSGQSTQATQSGDAATGTEGVDASAIAGEIFTRESAMDGGIGVAAAKVNAAMGKARPKSPTLQAELQALVAAAGRLQADARACADSRAPTLAEAAGYMVVRAQALQDGYMAWYGGAAYQSYFQTGHDAKYKGLGYDEKTGKPVVGGLQQRINAAFAE